MLFKHSDYPEEGDIVLCTVKKILPHAVFVSLDEYENKDGMVHISEIAPGRIRNIRDYVKPEKKIVCVILKVNQERKNIDLSLRRVPLNVKKNKIDEIKQEEKSEKILKSIAQKVNVKEDEFYKNVGLKLIEEYGSLFGAFQEITAKGKDALKNVTLDPKISEMLVETIKEKIKPPIVDSEGILELKSDAENGIELIKESIVSGLEKSKKYDCEVTYISAPRYRIKVTGEDYKSAEKGLEETAKFILEEVKKRKGIGSLQKK